jgi:hypothetical protein
MISTCGADVFVAGRIERAAEPHQRRHRTPFGHTAGHTLAKPPARAVHGWRPTSFPMTLATNPPRAAGLSKRARMRVPFTSLTPALAAAVNVWE